jgi:hypothetical protein
MARHANSFITWLYHVSPAEKLLSCITTVIKTLGPLCDATTKQPLFNDKAWIVAKNMLEHIWNGDYSDLPDIAMYSKVGKDKNGLTLYCCFHGTNDVEGGVHQNLIWQFTSFNVSSHRAVNMILDYVSAHNMQVATFFSHTDLELSLMSCTNRLERWTAQADATLDTVKYLDSRIDSRIDSQAIQSWFRSVNCLWIAL